MWCLPTAQLAPVVSAPKQRSTSSLPAPLVCSALQAGKGFQFVSDTDTEVIPKLCQYVHNSSPPGLPLSEVRGGGGMGERSGGGCGGAGAGTRYCCGVAAKLQLSRAALSSSIPPPLPPSASQLVLHVMAHLEGAYALLIKSAHHPGELVACKRGSPLILGLRTGPAAAAGAKGGAATGDGGRGGGGGKVRAVEGFECFLASDASAVVEHTKK